MEEKLKLMVKNRYDFQIHHSQITLKHLTDFQAPSQKNLFYNFLPTGFIFPIFYIETDVNKKLNKMLETHETKLK